MRATYLNSLSVVSILLLTITSTTVPARADVNITAAQVGETNEVIISFDATSETNLVRAFALDIRLDNDANIVSVVGLSTDYWVYPGTIQIDASGNITYLGIIAAEVGDLPGDTLPGPPDGNGVTLECASLYAPVGPGSPNAPAKSGDLASIIVNKSTCLSISANVARAGPTGVVMENPNEIAEVSFTGPVCVDLNDFGCIGCRCGMPDYDEWVLVGSPACWCYARQCRGDADGIKSGPFWVAVPDLNMFRAAFNKMDAALALVPNGICADFDHIKSGPFRVAVPDLNIFRQYFNKIETLVPECPSNYWEIP